MDCVNRQTSNRIRYALAEMYDLVRDARTPHNNRRLVLTRSDQLRGFNANRIGGYWWRDFGTRRTRRHRTHSRRRSTP